ncbi:N-acetylmuramoyl-L-alanine amidase AmiD precursor [Serratia entomophila]|uniref:N-acetylmuramoyl-L-alanine amidase n=1 Tax=Serratia entomophila TaxID=42906 RepID=A0ABY5CXL1_9GAMM|nr:N-acetylmuramoyl-L-alanine amidase [Serratia entomophila]UIW19969.1 N-acetylmuramoyl-L-alanine amidase [Serratia entomophila]USV02490.1 N-acetylmuramoyl-L-alanine amidase [Serratia entomophila]CAI0748137.1 N-acetylmuramoyl-L-alanine amidase AmiD precursor [Serratia entomophila]CAI0760162.1 N-acetylmuramoyl-L-alanine amidase AmiD precursor [Serratia entomophila]CAI0775633.1 N-acetylmuramoyl-L-alanine amidase AmiD precursor [Serratia entomophila]
MKIWPGIFTAALLAGCQNPHQGTTVDRGDYQLETLHQAQGADRRIRFLVMHYTAEDFHSSLKTLTDEHVSAHYLLPAHPQLEHGKPTAFQLVPEEMRAWHAGVSGWRGRSNLNDTSIGIEIVNRGFTRSMLFTHWQPYTAEQIALLIPLSRDIIRRYGIQPPDVVGHSDIAPQRKQDPGPLFPWQALAEAGIGAWPDAAEVQRLLAGRDKHAPVPMAPLLARLARYGYAIDPAWDVSQQRNVLAAFQMHFRPDDFRGEPDAESEAIVDALLLKYGAAR